MSKSESPANALSSFWNRHLGPHAAALRMAALALAVVTLGIGAGYLTTRASWAPAWAAAPVFALVFPLQLAAISALYAHVRGSALGIFRFLTVPVWLALMVIFVAISMPIFLEIEKSIPVSESDSITQFGPGFGELTIGFLGSFFAFHAAVFNGAIRAGRKSA